MAGRLLALAARNIKVRNVPVGTAGAHGSVVVGVDPRTTAIGSREVVGYGMNGQPNYIDRADYPMPAIRWRELSKDLKMLREKEKGDWGKLSMEEKKALYRASFCQTFAEFKAPTGEWKSVLGMGLVVVSLGVWLYIAMKVFVYNPRPESFNQENKEAQLRRMLDIRANPIEGISSKWDYEKDAWK